MNNFVLDNDDDSTLLIYSDWLEENGFLSLAEDIRMDVEGSRVNFWDYECHADGIGETNDVGTPIVFGFGGDEGGDEGVGRTHGVGAGITYDTSGVGSADGSFSGVGSKD